MADVVGSGHAQVICCRWENRGRVAGLLESLHAELDIGLKVAGLSIVLYHLVVDLDGGRYSSGNSGGGRLIRMCMIEIEGARCVKDNLHSKLQGHD